MASLVITVILNTNRREDTLEALESLGNADYPNHKIILLDNASQDGSVEAIRSNYPGVHVIKLNENLGYAGNNNVGIQAAIEMGAAWVLVLNEDTVLAPDCISRLVSAAETDDQVGIVGPMVYHFDHPEVIQSAGGIMGADWRAAHLDQNEYDTGQQVENRLVDWISGCAIMVRRDVIEQIGGLDDRFFYYFEETEWCLRARLRGWKIMHVPHAKLWHKGVQLQYQPGENVTYYGTRNRLLMLSIHRAPVRVWLTTWFDNLRTLMSWSIKPKWRSKRKHRDAMLEGIWDFLNQRWGMRRN